MSRQFQLRAFSLIELLIAAAIFVLLGAIGLASLNLIKKERLLSSSADRVLDVLRLAQNKTLASEGASSYGVRFETHKFIFFAGNAFSSSSPDNQEFPIIEGILIGEINLGGGSDVVFERLSGNASSSGSIVLEVDGDASKNKTIYIEPSGTMDFFPSLSSGSERVADNRRIRFSYAQNTKNAVTLYLYFPENNYTYQVSYQAGLDAGKTAFYWKGTVDVGGQEQELLIHSAGLSDAETIFCVHRDRRYNSKALQISLDGQNLINYTADGQVSQGSSIWAGEPQLR